MRTQILALAVATVLVSPMAMAATPDSVRLDHAPAHAPYGLGPQRMPHHTYPQTEQRQDPPIYGTLTTGDGVTGPRQAPSAGAAVGGGEK